MKWVIRMVSLVSGIIFIDVLSHSLFIRIQRLSTIPVEREGPEGEAKEAEGDLRSCYATLRTFPLEMLEKIRRTIK